eukprot:gene12211-12348_t
MRRHFLQPPSALDSGSQEQPFSRQDEGAPLSGVEKLPSHTGSQAGGPQDVSAGAFVPSSDTHPDLLDPAESRTYTSREGASGGSNTGGHSHSSSERRSHPVARAAGTALGTAAGTVLGAVGGPATAGLGAALGASAGRGLVDALAGTKEQAGVYDQGAEPEQVAEELAGVAQPVAEAAEEFAADVRGGAGKLQAQDRLQEARESVSGRLHDASTSTTAHQGLNAQPSGRPGPADAGRPSSSSSSRAVEHEDTYEGMGQETVDDLRAMGLADSGPGNLFSAAGFDAELQGQGTSPGAGIRHDPPAPGSRNTAESSHADHASVGDRVAGAASAVVDRVASAARTTADKVASAADSVPLPTFPPAAGDPDEPLAAGGGTTMPAADRAAERMAEAADKAAGAAGRVADRLSGTADTVREGAREAAHTAADTVRGAAHKANDRLAGAGDSVKERAGNMSETAADYGSTGSLEKMAEMGQSQRDVNDDATEGTARPVGAEGDWGVSERSIDWAALSDAEKLVKEDVGLPSVIVQDGLDLAGAVAGSDSSLPGAAGATGAAGGYSSGLGDAGEVLDSQRATMAGGSGTRDSDMSRMMMSNQTAADSDLQSKVGQAIRDIESGAGLPEGRLAPPAGVDSQAAVAVEPGTTGEATSDSTAERVAQKYGIGEDASAGVDEAQVYR